MPSNEIAGALRLEKIDTDRYLGQNIAGTQGVIFGGQLLAQAIVAAARSVPEMQVKSMHTVFTRAGQPDQPVTLDVDRLNEGRTFGCVEVSIRQGDRLCTRSLVLLDRPDADLIYHHDAMPDVAPPEACRPGASVERGWDVRIVDDVDIADPNALGPPELFVWSRFTGLPAENYASQALLGYASDGFLIGTAMRPHPGVGQALAHVSISTSVITQTLTFHDSFDAGEWLLLAHASPYAGHGRSHGRAHVFSTDGRLVASYVQENMIRAFGADTKY
jgi:acyl-CoA thioesterase-2